MLRHRRSLTPLALASCLLLTSCASSSLGEALKNRFAADPKLTGSISSPTPTAVSSQSSQANPLVQLPDDFPTAIPRYPGSELRQVVPGKADSSSDLSQLETRWVSQDGSDRIISFYRKAFRSDKWQILSESNVGTNGGRIVARQNDLNVTVTVQPSAPEAATSSTQAKTSATPTASSELIIQYARSASQSGQAEAPSPKASNDLSKLAPFSDSINLGASGDSNSTQAQAVSGDVPFTDLSKVPAELRQSVEDVAKLGILTPAAASQKQNQAKGTSLFEPNKTITRREYARWLVAANNRLYGDRPTQQIRLGVTSSQPAFRDVPRTDPDFPAIQGLAEAGIIPSSLSGDPTVVNFRPNAPLTRENLLLWKVPIDTHQALPTANIDAVKQTWGFQDAAKIDPRALRAVLADHQNGDLSNIRRAFGYTTLFQPKKPVTRAEAAATLWYFGFQGEGQSAQDALKTDASGTQPASQSAENK